MLAAYRQPPPLLVFTRSFFSARGWSVHHHLLLAVESGGGGELRLRDWRFGDFGDLNDVASFGSEI